ncbi:unnamed protein product [Paramecium pentaurelia]|uniref:Protein kinase domain-containing protein n=1 Tax=Paramecium pentaurelia TaxID=43138 RepID=A0A8S1W6Q6_9CILI|nr:unnamed protein product [Paramecium pentaurelia]
MKSVNNTIRIGTQMHQKHRLLKVPRKTNHHITLDPINRFNQVKDYTIKRMEFKLGKLIGSGSQGQVYQAMNMYTGEIVACKKLLNHLKDQQKLDTELSFLQILQHKNIIKYIFHESTKDSILIYQEFMSMGSISQLIRDFGPINEQTVKRYTQQILNGLEYLHKKGILHLDLKSSNILLDCNGQVKISDFGCSRQNKENLYQSILQGSVPWMAPEVVRQERIGPASDIWSFGCLILEMITGRPPWSEQINFDNPATSLLSIGLSGEYPRIPETASIEIKELLLMCFQVDPLQRATLRKLKQSAFLQ